MRGDGLSFPGFGLVCTLSGGGVCCYPCSPPGARGTPESSMLHGAERREPLSACVMGREMARWPRAVGSVLAGCWGLMQFQGKSIEVFLQAAGPGGDWGRRGPLGPAVLAVCRGGLEASHLGTEGLPSPRLQSWMARGCPETSEEPVTHGRLFRLRAWGLGQGEAQRGQRRGARCARGIWEGVRDRVSGSFTWNMPGSPPAAWGQGRGFTCVSWSRTRTWAGGVRGGTAQRPGVENRGTGKVVSTPSLEVF